MYVTKEKAEMLNDSKFPNIGTFSSRDIMK